MPAVLKLTLLGPFRASDSTGREIALRSRKARALLAYLALNAGTRIERERLAALLWDDSDTDAARTSLRQALASLRRALPDADGDVLLTDASSIAVDPDAFDCDAARVRSLLLDGRIDALIEAMELYRGDLLAGFESHSNAYEEWLAQERRVLRRDLVAGVERLVRACAESHDSGGQLEALTRLLAIDPSNERAHRSLMQLHAALGDHTAALRQYRLCREALRRDLDVAPEPATEALYREIMKRRRADRPAPADSATANEETNAVVESDPPLGNATMREAIVVAVRLPGMGSAQSGLDPEEARSLTTSAAAAVREAVERHGGAADRPMGERMLAVFGIGKTRGNEPAHAAAAASEIAIELGRTHPSLPPAIGVAAGQLLPASQDDVFPLAGPAVGAAIDLSQSAAQHEILLSDAAQRALIDQRGFMVTALDPPRPGLSGRVWRLDPGFTAPGGSSRVTPFSGRHAEVSLANGLVERAVELRRGRTLLVRGEPGIGKTRLVEIVRRIARERGLAEHVAVVLDCGQSQAQRPLAVL
ncbi:MAG TPA: BTAD domain-containing putative transcriptional regulator, partial [Steroidobacteraceae bacterium]|nr:BTAD domain-containing putative transcriptional regulator [Steroidobacteraceae bacterium]